MGARASTASTRQGPSAESLRRLQSCRCLIVQHLREPARTPARAGRGEWWPGTEIEPPTRGFSVRSGAARTERHMTRRGRQCRVNQPTSRYFHTREGGPDGLCRVLRSCGGRQRGAVLFQRASTLARSGCESRGGRGLRPRRHPSPRGWPRRPACAPTESAVPRPPWSPSLGHRRRRGRSGCPVVAARPRGE